MSRCRSVKSRRKQTSNRVHSDLAHDDVAKLIDNAFAAKLKILENGRVQKRTVLQEIYRQLWTREMEGNLQAINVRLAYEKFVLEQSPVAERDTIVIGGLPEQDPLWAEVDGDE